jgi:4-diphosphocytidyl-2-C-methyl-D-erythritol kinase
LPKNYPALWSLMISLGADVPVCYAAQTARVQGIGEQIAPLPSLPAIPAVLVHPNVPAPTALVFSRFEAAFKNTVTLPDPFETCAQMISLLNTTENDLYRPACSINPAIAEVITAIEQTTACLLARMSGSGSSCFGLYAHEKEALQAAEKLRKQHPDWWIQSTWLGPEKIPKMVLL